MKKLSIIEALTPTAELGISSFIGMSKDEIEKTLDAAPIGAIITGVINRRGPYDIDVHIEKCSSKRANYFAPIGSPNDWKYQEVTWKKGGYDDPYIVRTIYEIINDTSKYYQMLPGLKMTNKQQEIYGIQLHSDMTDINFFAVHKDKQVLKDNWKDICEYISGSSDETDKEQMYKELAAKGIIFGSDEIYDGRIWKEATEYDPYDEDQKKLGYFLILLGSIEKEEDWYKIDVISYSSYRF